MLSRMFSNSTLQKIFVGLASTSLLTACNPIEPAVNIPEGQVVNCSEIRTVENLENNLVLDCLDGKSAIDLADLAGPTVVNFWGSWCGPCRDEIPYFVDLNNSLPEGLQLIGVNREEKSAADAERFITELGITYPQLSDQTGASKVIVGPSVPVTLFITDKGEITYQHIGPIDSVDELRSLILEHLGI